jgi:microcin C transport system substrate-binding protein
LIGIKNKAIDALIKAVIESESREDLITSTRALDRALLHNYYVIPQWYIGSHRIAYWDKFSKPATAEKYDPSFFGNWMTWSIDKEKAERIKQYTHKLQ